MIIFHNPRCTKSRETLALLEKNGVNPQKRLYLDDPPNEEELIGIVTKLKIKAEDLVRRSEGIYKEKYKGKDLSEKEWIKAMVEHPKLIERPIVIKGQKAVIGRPPSNVLELL